MTKQEILEAFEGQFVKTDYGDGMQIPPSEYIEMGSVGNLRNFLSTSIDSLLQEDDLPKELKTNLNNLSLQGRLYAKAFDSGFSSCLSQVKELIKSKIK